MHLSRSILAVSLLAGGLSVLSPTGPALAVGVPGGTITQVSVASDGTPSNGESSNAAISPDGRYTVFVSGGSALRPPGVTSGGYLYLHDSVTGTTELIGRDATGAPLADAILTPSLSNGARYISFLSNSTALDPTAPAGVLSAYLLNRETGDLTLITADVPGNEKAQFVTAALTPDGRYVALNVFTSDQQILGYRYEVATGDLLDLAVTPDGDPAPGGAAFPMLSADGRWVAFNYYGPVSDMVPGPAGSAPDQTKAALILRDLDTGTNIIASKAADGSTITADYVQISADGRYLTYESTLSTIVPGDTNGTGDVFLFDRVTGTTRLVSTTPDGGPSNGYSSSAAPSNDGRSVLFASRATNLTPDETDNGFDFYLKDLDSGAVVRVVDNAAGERPDVPAAAVRPTFGYPFVVDDEDTFGFVFGSRATNLVPGDTNGANDIFVYTFPTTAASSPTLSRAPQVGAPVSAVAADPPAGGSVGYQWAIDGEPVPGATDATFVPPASAAGGMLTVTTRTTDFAHSPALLTSTPTRVAPGTLASATPRIRGTAKVGKTLTALPGRWTSGTTFRYRWSADGKPIKGATRSTFVLTGKQRTTTITVTVTGSQAGYTSTTRTSAATRVVR